MLLKLVLVVTLVLLLRAAVLLELLLAVTLVLLQRAAVLLELVLAVILVLLRRAAVLLDLVLAVTLAFLVRAAALLELVLDVTLVLLVRAAVLLDLVLAMLDVRAGAVAIPFLATPWRVVHTQLWAGWLLHGIHTGRAHIAWVQMLLVEDWHRSTAREAACQGLV